LLSYLVDGSQQILPEALPLLVLPRILPEHLPLLVLPEFLLESLPEAPLLLALSQVLPELLPEALLPLALLPPFLPLVLPTQKSEVLLLAYMLQTKQPHQRFHYLRFSLKFRCLLFQRLRFRFLKSRNLKLHFL